MVYSDEKASAERIVLPGLFTFRSGNETDRDDYGSVPQERIQVCYCPLKW